MGARFLESKRIDSAIILKPLCALNPKRLFIHIDDKMNKRFKLFFFQSLGMHSISRQLFRIDISTSLRNFSTSSRMGLLTPISLD